MSRLQRVRIPPNSARSCRSRSRRSSAFHSSATSNGALVNHVWSVAGDEDHAHVSQTFLQPFVSYTTKTYTSFGFQTESAYDWTQTKWTVPLIAPVSQVLKIAGQPISLQLAPKWYAEGPTAAPDWGIRFAFIFLFPKK